jgi:hypothetical protein
MSENFNRIMEGLEEAQAIAEGRAQPHRVHHPEAPPLTTQETDGTEESQ